MLLREETFRNDQIFWKLFFFPMHIFVVFQNKPENYYKKKKKKLTYSRIMHAHAEISTTAAITNVNKLISTNNYYFVVYSRIIRIMHSTLLRYYR